MEILNYVTSGLKVLVDRTSDFVSYYMMTDNDLDENNNDIQPISQHISQPISKHISQPISQPISKPTKKRIFTPKSKLEQIQTFFSEPTHIIDNIYLGSAFNASNYNSLKQNNIGLIINMTNEISNYYENEFEYKKYGVYDNNIQPIIQFFDKAYSDIIEFQQYCPTKNILIHCFMGASRSASIVAYYINKKHNKNINDAIIFMKNKRIVVNPTVLFYNQLLEIENS
jgi:protein-tyrosine phosphatase